MFEITFTFLKIIFIFHYSTILSYFKYFYDIINNKKIYMFQLIILINIDLYYKKLIGLYK
ncbi:hypothetical protein GCM10008907_25640 [Clostridium sartagoforme]|jgi:hypothetical protein